MPIPLVKKVITPPTLTAFGLHLEKQNTFSNCTMKVKFYTLLLLRKAIIKSCSPFIRKLYRCIMPISNRGLWRKNKI